MTLATRTRATASAVRQPAVRHSYAVTAAPTLPATSTPTTSRRYSTPGVRPVHANTPLSLLGQSVTLSLAGPPTALVLLALTTLQLPDGDVVFTALNKR